MRKIQKVSDAALREIVETREPHGLFYWRARFRCYIGVDNSTGDAWTEEFHSLRQCNSFYQVLSAEAYTKHGLNVHAVVFDELHAQPNRQLYDVMTHGSGDARKQPLYFLITTAGNDTNSICYEIHQKATDILEGRKNDSTFYPVIYGAAESEDWTDPKVWRKANPSLGVTVDEEKLQIACESARQNPAEENLFRQLRLCQWVKQRKTGRNKPPPPSPPAGFPQGNFYMHLYNWLKGGMVTGERERVIYLDTRSAGHYNGCK